MVGIGLVPSVAWIAFTVGSGWLIRGAKGELALSFLGVMILATSIFIAAWRSKPAITRFGNTSINYFPAGGAIRAVSRYMIFLTLPMSIAFAYGLQRCSNSLSKQG